MTVPTGSEPRRRPLTDDELAVIRQRIINAPDTATLLYDAVRAVYAPMLADAGGNIDELPEGELLNPGDYALPASQGNAIIEAISRRAEAWGTTVQIAIELPNYMPRMYEDPNVAAPRFDLPDFRPDTYTLRLTRDAIDAIGAAEHHLYHLLTDYGPRSEQYLVALTGWHRSMAALFSRASGVNATVWHGDFRRCTAPSCGAVIDDDGAARPDSPDAVVVDHVHEPSYPIGRTRPGHWSMHS